MKNVFINIRISEELKKEFDNKCKANMQTPSIVIRELMKRYITSGMKVFKEEEKC